MLLASPASAEMATCYGPGYDGGMTASGEQFNAGALTAAHPYLPFGTQLLISYDGASVPVTVNDRGPLLDLSCGAMGALGLPPGMYDVGVS